MNLGHLRLLQSFVFSVILSLGTLCAISSAQLTVTFSDSPATEQSRGQQSNEQLSVDDVIKLSKAGLSDDVIIAQIKKRSRPFDLSTDQLIQLKAARVSDRVIEVMTGTQGDAAKTKPKEEVQPSSGVAPAARQKETGRIRGTLTYYFNANYGNRPDTGAEVLLCREPVSIPDDGVASLTSYQLGVSTGGEVKTYDTVAFTIADGNGNFEMAEIPPGEYTIVMHSNHVKGKLVPVLVTTDKKGKPLKKPRLEQRPTVRDVMGVITTGRITVEAGKVADASYDFGISVF